LKAHPPRLEWWGAQYLPAQTASDEPVVSCLSGAFHDVCNRAAKMRGMNYGADMRLLVNQGKTPTVLFGPGDIRKAHQPNEFVPINDLLKVAQTLALTVMRFCGVK